MQRWGPSPVTFVLSPSLEKPPKHSKPNPEAPKPV